MKKRSFRLLTIAAALALIAAIGSSLAYLSAADSDVNTFRVGSVDIVISEPEWNGAVSLKQEQLIPKDPTVTNTGNNPAFIFLRVDIPKEEIYIYDPATKMRFGETTDGTAPKYTAELFQLGNSEIGYTSDWRCNHSVKNGWTLISTDKTNEKFNSYYYAYGTSSAMKKLDPEASTPALFDNVRYSTGVEGQGLDLETNPHSIIINAYAIQSDDLGGNDTSDPREVWKLIANEVYGADKATLP